ncbi:DUF7475 family protein [Haladaptatus sp. NG-SE-30]
MATAAKQSLSGNRVDAIQWFALILAAITGAIHVYKGLGYGGAPLLLAGVGFFGGIALYVVGVKRRWLYVLGIPYTLAQMILWVEMGLPYLRLGLFDKAIQLLFISVLGYLYVSR